MSRATILKHVRLIGQGADWNEVLTSFANDPEVPAKLRDKAVAYAQSGGDPKQFMLAAARTAPAGGKVEPLEPASTERAGGLGETASTLMSPEYGKGVWGDVAEIGVKTGIPIAAGAVAAPAGPVASALAAAAASQGVRSAERAYIGKPALEYSDIPRAAFDVLTGSIGAKLGNIGKAGEDQVKRALANMVYNTGTAAAGSEMENALAGKQPIGQSSYNMLTGLLSDPTMAINLLSSAIAGRQGGQRPSELATPLNPTELALMDVYNRDAATKGTPAATPEQVREAVNSMMAVKDMTVGGDVKQNPITAYGLVDRLKQTLAPAQEVVPDVVKQSLEAIPPAQRTAVSLQGKPINMPEFMGTPTDVELTPTLQQLGREVPAAGKQVANEATMGAETTLGQLEPTSEYQTGRTKMQETIEGLVGEQRAKQAGLEDYKARLQDESRMTRMNQLREEANALSVQADEALARYEAAVKAAETAGPEARTAAIEQAMQQKQILDQAEAAYEKARVGLEMDDTVFKLRQAERVAQTEQGIERGYKASLPTAEQYRQVGETVQEVAGGTPKAIRKGASIVYGEDLAKIEAQYGNEPVRIPPQMVTPDLIQDIFARNVSDRLKRKLGQYMEIRSGQEPPEPVTVSDVMEIYRSMNQSAPGASASFKAKHDFGLLMESMRNRLSGIDPALGEAFGVMNADYKRSMGEAKNIKEAVGGGMESPYQAARVGRAYVEAPETAPKSQLLESPLMGKAGEEVAALRRQVEEARQTRDTARFGLKQQTLAENRGQAVMKQRGLAQAKREAYEPVEQYKRGQAAEKAGMEAENRAQAELGQQQQGVTNMLGKLADKRAAAQAQADALDLDQKIRLAESTTRQEVEGLKQLQSDLADVLNAPKKTVGKDTASRAEMAENISKIKVSADTAVEAGVITPAERTELLKALAKSVIEQTAVSKVPFAETEAGRGHRQVEGKDIPSAALKLLDNNLARELRTAKPVSKETVSLFSKMMELAKNTSKSQAVLDFFNRNFADIEEGGTSSYDKMERAFDSVRKSPDSPTFSTLMSEVLNKVLVTGKDGGVDFKHAAEVWASLPEALKKRVYGPNYEFMDKINRNLFPTLAVADKYIRTNKIYSWISSFRSYLSSASYISKFGMSGALGLAGYTGGGLIGALGTLSIPLIAGMLARVPHVYLNSITRQGIKPVESSRLAAAAGMAGGKQYERK